MSEPTRRGRSAVLDPPAGQPVRQPVGRPVERPVERPALRPTAATGARPDGPRAGRQRLSMPGGFLLLIALLVVLNLIGLVMVLSASSIESIRVYGSPWYYFERQALWLALGTGAFLVTLRMDYRWWRRLGPVLVIVTIGLLVAVLVPGFGISVSGSSRWLGIGTWRVQPSELAKFALVVFAADLLDRRGHRMSDWRYSMTPVIVVFAVMAALVMLQPDMGTTLVLAAIVLGALYVAGSPLGPTVAIGLAGAGIGSIMAVAAPYRWRRMTAFLHPFADASNTGYQSAQGLVALGSGHLAGIGIGASRASWGYLPNQETDFIFAIIGEETGLIGTLLIVGLFVAFAVAGVRAACRAPDRFGALLASGITAWIVGQAVINIGAVVGLLPVTGVPLPFVSFGGSSLVITMAAVGILANVAKRAA